jgi:hypothetical protein
VASGWAQYFAHRRPALSAEGRRPAWNRGRQVVLYGRSARERARSEIVLAGPVAQPDRAAVS